MVFDTIRYSNFGSLHKFPVEFISYLNLRISKSQKYYVMLLHHNNINRNNNLFLTYDLYIKWVIFKSFNNINRNSNLASIYDLHAKWKIFQSCMITIQITKNTVSRNVLLQNDMLIAAGDAADTCICRDLIAGDLLALCRWARYTRRERYSTYRTRSVYC